jgi:hypothetical protein
MGFSIFVEVLNLQARRRKEGEPVKLRSPYQPEKVPPVE